MYVSRVLLRKSLWALRDVHPFFGFSYLAFKKARLPVGDPVSVNFSSLMEMHLERYFRPIPGINGYYNPFSSSRPGQRWLARRYPSTSLQRITVDTFGESFEHEKGSSLWAWKENYLEVFERKLGGRKLPALMMAAWFYRNDDLGAASSQDLVDLLRRDFYLDLMEWKTLFDDSYEIGSESYFHDFPLTSDDIENEVGSPPEQEQVRGAALKELEISAVGPARTLHYFPAERINLITGDNSVGKTFLLDSVWWALTGTWAYGVLIPFGEASIGKPTVSAKLSVSSKLNKSRAAQFSTSSQSWEQTGTRDSPGLVLYARHDGSTQVFDPTLSEGLRRVDLTSDEVKNGKFDDNNKRSICNGLVRDWVSWQLQPSRYKEQWEAFSVALSALSPQDLPLSAGDPIRLAGNEQDIPTIRMPYGDAPLTHASAAVTRVLSLAYVLVWAWSRHSQEARKLGQKSAGHIAILIDELEAHLHPKWQRTVLPSLAKTVRQLSPYAAIQMHIATHSPLVLASAEQIFEPAIDGLFTLDFDGRDVVMNERTFTRQGRVDRWLTSEIFGLGESRSLDAERAIEAAQSVMLSRGDVERAKVQATHTQLVESLAQDDDFWPRWLPYAQRYGVIK